MISIVACKSIGLVKYTKSLILQIVLTIEEFDLQ